MQNNTLKTYSQSSEAVAIGHPDKVADSIADSVLDVVRGMLPDAHTAVEVACGATKLMVFGEVDVRLANRKDKLQQIVEQVVRKRLAQIGYSLEYYNPQLVYDIVTQSSEINQAVTHSTDTDDTGAGDQGIMFGYAVRETPQMHHLHFVLAHLLQKKLEQARLSGQLDFLLPDAKSQVTVTYQYSESGIDVPIGIPDIILSTQHTKKHTAVNFSQMCAKLQAFTIDVINQYLQSNNFKITVDDSTNIHINPAGAWHNGGPAFDSGLTGRKLVVDNYGGGSPIGGGAYSGKDLTKVDRSAAYYARYVAKSIVTSQLADKVQIALAYAIGESTPTMVSIDTFGTGVQDDYDLLRLVKCNFDFSVGKIIEFTSQLQQFTITGEHSHYLSSPEFATQEFPWEQPKLLKL